MTYTLEEIFLRPGLIRQLDQAEQTTERCLVAVSRNGNLLRFIKLPTPEVDIAAVTQSPTALRWVGTQSNEVCQAALSKDGMALRHVLSPTLEHAYIAVNQEGLALKYASFQTPELCLAAVRNNGLALEYVMPSLRTPEVCQAAVAENGDALEFVDLPKDALLDPCSDQLKNWVSVVSACQSTDEESLRDVIHPIIDHVSFDALNAHQWTHPIDADRMFLDVASDLAHELKRLAGRDQKISSFLHKMNDVIESMLLEIYEYQQIQMRSLSDKFVTSMERSLL